MSQIKIGVVSDITNNKVWVTVSWIAEVKAKAQVGIWDPEARKWVSDVYHGEWKDPIPELWYQHTFQLSILAGTKQGTYRLWAAVINPAADILAEDSRDITVPGVKVSISWGWLVLGALALWILFKGKKR